MKAALLLLPFLFSFAIAVPLNCIAYEPFGNKNYPSNVDLALNQDLQSLSSHGFTCIKTYYSQYYGLKVSTYAKKFNLKVVLGVWMEDSSFIDAEINAAIYSCLNLDNVIALYAGNENLPARSLQSILDVKAKVRNGGCNKPFGTVQTIGYFLSNPDKSFLAQMDWLGYNVYPFFSTLGGGTSLASLRAQIQRLKSAYPDQFSKFKISETGWPSEGSASPQGNPSTLAKAKEYADGFAAMLCSGEITTDWVSYFTYFDPAYKVWAPDYERHFGISDQFGNLKWDVSNLHCTGGSNDHSNNVTPNQKSFYFKNTDISGADIANKPASAPEKCFDLCYQTTGCQAFTWTNYTSGTCWLKSNSASRISNSGAYSGTLCKLQTGFDVNGAVVATSSGVSTAQGCCGICAKNDICGAFAWNNFNGGTCWMKAKSEGVVNSAGVVAFTG